MVKPLAFKGRDKGRYKVRYKGLRFLSRQPFIFKPPPIKARRRKPRVLHARSGYSEEKKEVELHARKRLMLWCRRLNTRQRLMLWCRQPRFLKPSGNILQPGILLPRVTIPVGTDYTDIQPDSWRLPNPGFPRGNYTLLLMNPEQRSHAGCKCPQNALSSSTGDALVRCNCPKRPPGADAADYLDEHEDEHRLYLEDEVRLRYFTPKPSALRARRTRPPLTLLAVCTFPYNSHDDGATYLRENESA